MSTQFCDGAGFAFIRLFESDNECESYCPSSRPDRRSRGVWAYTYDLVCMQAMIDIASEAGWLTTALATMRLVQSVIQVRQALLFITCHLP